MMEPICFVTSNPNKLRELSKLLERSLEQVRVEFEEIQTSDLQVLVTHKLGQAWKRVQKPLIVEDTSLYFEAWNGMPGPLIKWFVKHMGARGLVQTLEGFSDHRASAVCCLGYTSDGDQMYTFKGEVSGTIVPPRGSFNFGWDPVFQPDGSRRTFGEMSETEKGDYSMRGRAAAKFRGFLAGEEGQK